MKFKLIFLRPTAHRLAILWKSRTKHINNIGRFFSIKHRNLTPYSHILHRDPLFTHQPTSKSSPNLALLCGSSPLLFTYKKQSIVRTLNTYKPTPADIKQADLFMNAHKNHHSDGSSAMTDEKKAVLIIAFEDTMSKKEKQLGWAINLINHALSQNPDAQIYIALSPETSALTTLVDSAPSQNITFIDQYEISDVLHTIKQAYVYNNDMGLDFLIQDIPVHVSGTPFYAGWGFTTDLRKQKNRKRKHTLSSFVATYTAKHLKALNHKTKKNTPLNKALQKTCKPNDKRLFEDLHFNILEYNRLKKHSLAEGLLQKATSIRPNNFSLHSLSAKIYRKQQPMKALEHYKAALKLRPCSPNLYYDLAQTYRRAGIYNSETSKAFERALEINNNVNFKHIESYVDYLWEYEGVTAKLIEFLKNTTNLQECPAGLRLKYAAILNEAGFSSKAFCEYKQAVENNPNCAEKSRYLALKAAVTTIDPSCPGAAQHEKDLYNTLLKTQGDFRKLVLQHKDSLCVVGNSPCEMGKGKGDFIDSHDLVIRFNNFSVNYPFSKDYGTKTNVWAKTTRFLEIERRNVKDFDLVLISGSNTYHRSNIGYTFYQECVDQGIPVDIFPSSVAFDVTQKLEALPSAGIVLIAYLHSILGPLDPKSILGFSFTDQLTGEANHYSTGKKQLGYRHNWESEKELYKTLISPDNKTNIAT